MMRPRLHVLVLAVVIACCWLVPNAKADTTNNTRTHPDGPTTTDPPVASPQHSVDLISGRIEAAANGEDSTGAVSVLVASKASSHEQTAHSQSTGKAKATTTPEAGPAPALVLAAGGAVIGMVAVAFHRRRRARNGDRGIVLVLFDILYCYRRQWADGFEAVVVVDEQDPMRQSLLFHDMDYAAM